MATAIIALHVVGWGLLFVVASQQLELGASGVFGIGLGVTAYTLGMRHAFDVDHIAAVDNVSRKLLADNPDQGRPLSVGFWFSLGHSASSLAFVSCCLSVSARWGAKSPTSLRRCNRPRE